MTRAREVSTVTGAGPASRSDLARMRSYIGIDVGGTKTLGLILSETHEVLTSVVIPTDPSGNEAVQAGVLKVLEALMRRAAALNVEIAGVGVGAPGFVDSESGVMRDASNLRVRDLPLQARLESTLGLPTLLMHDVRAATLAEGRLGAAQGVGNFVYINVGTGIAAGFMFGGVLYMGEGGRAGEIGHLILQPEGPSCSCGKRGCLEALAAGPALERAVRAAIRSNPTSVLAKLSQSGANQTAIQGAAPDVGDSVQGGILHHLAAAAEAGDEQAEAILATATGHLGQVVSWLVDSLAPERVIIGGGVASLGNTFLAPLRRSVKARTLEANWRTDLITPAAFTDDAGGVGAAIAAHQRFALSKEDLK